MVILARVSLEKRAVNIEAFFEIQNCKYTVHWNVIYQSRWSLMIIIIDGSLRGSVSLKKEHLTRSVRIYLNGAMDFRFT